MASRLQTMVVKRRDTMDTCKADYVLPLHDEYDFEHGPLNKTVEEDESDSDYTTQRSYNYKKKYIPRRRSLTEDEEDDIEELRFSSSSTTTTTTTTSSGWKTTMCSPASLDSVNLLSNSAERTFVVFTAKRRNSPLFSMLAFLFFLGGLFLYCQSHAEMQSALIEVTALSEQRNLLKSKMYEAESIFKSFNDELILIDEMERDQDGSSGGRQLKADSDKALKEMKRLQNKLNKGAEMIDSLHEHIQFMSLRDGVAKYGSGVHRVLLELEFPEGSPTLKPGGDDPTTIVMEMAQFEYMPHSVYTFMEMVAAGLIDGCSFIINAQHVLKAAPLPYDGSSAAAKVRAFTFYGLESVSFREYSPSFPHERYTVGFAADGSPSFYINTQDNSEIHEGEPCFAKIVSGFDTIKRLEENPTRNGIWYKQRIGIKRASILP